MLSGDEFYGDDITSGIYFSESLSESERESLITAIWLFGEYDKPTLRTMDDEELLNLADEYAI